MKRNWRRILSLILAAAMILTMNTQAFAADAVSADSKSEVPGGTESISESGSAGTQVAAAETAAVTEACSTESAEAESEDAAGTAGENTEISASEDEVSEDIAGAVSADTAEAAGSSVDWKPAAEWKVLSTMKEAISGASVSYNTDAEGKMTLLVNYESDCLIVYSGSVEVTATVIDSNPYYAHQMKVSNNSVCPLCLTKGFNLGSLKWKYSTVYVSDNKYISQATDALVSSYPTYQATPGTMPEEMYTISYDACTISFDQAVTAGPDGQTYSEYGTEPRSVSRYLSTNKETQLIVKRGGTFYTLELLAQANAPSTTYKIVTPHSDRVSFGIGDTNFYYACVPASESADYISRAVWKKYGNEEITITGLTENTTYYFAAKNPATGNQFPNYALCSTPFTTGAKKHVTLTPKISENLVLISGDTADARAIFDYSAKVNEDGSDYKAMSSTVSFNYYLGDAAYRNISANVTLPKAGTYTLSMDTGIFTTKSDQTYSKNDYIISLGTCPAVKVIDPAAAGLTLTASGTYYYGQDPETVLHKGGLTMEGFNVLKSSNVSYRYGTELEGGNIKTDIKNTGVEKLDADTAFYMQAVYTCSGHEIFSNAVPFIVQARPLDVTVSCNFFSVRGDASYETGIALKDYISVLDTVSNTDGRAYADLDAVSADFTGIDLAGVHTAAQSYSVMGVKPVNGNYRIDSIAVKQGFGYYVLPSYTVNFCSMGTSQQVSASRIISSDAALKISDYRANSRNIDISSSAGDETKAKFSLPKTIDTDVTEGTFEGWYAGTDNKTLYAPGAEYTLTDDKDFYASLSKASNDPAGSYGALQISPIPSVKYTGLSHETDTDVSVRIRQVSENYTLVEGTDYTLRCKNNVNAYTSDGGAKAPCVIVRFIGRYKGKSDETVYFKILPADISEASVLSPAKNGYAATTNLSKIKALVKYETGALKTVTLKQDKDYTISGIWSAASDTEVTDSTPGSAALCSAGFYYISVNGTGNYKGTAKTSNFYAFDKKYKDASKLNMKPAKSSFEYDGADHASAAADITIKDGRRILDEQNFSIVVNNGESVTDAGRYEVKVSVKSPSDAFMYYGTKTLYLTVKEKICLHLRRERWNLPERARQKMELPLSRQRG